MPNTVNALRVFIIAVLMLISAPLAFAQNVSTPDYTSWQGIAARATDAVEASRASDGALTSLRSQLVDWRDIFDEARKTNRNAIDIVSAQLQALGPEPENGSEPAEIATQRQTLSASLAVLRAPVQTAEVAYAEADGLIGGIDAILRARQSDALLERGPSPLNPIHWPEATEDALASLRGATNEVTSAWGNENRFAEFKTNAPEVIFLVGLSFLLLSRGRRWFEKLAQSVQLESATLGRWLAASAVSLGQIIVPLAGLWALTAAAYATGFTGLRIELILSNLLWAGFLFLGTVWLGMQAFPKSLQVEPLVRLPLEQRIAGRFYATVLGALLSAEVLLAEIAAYDTWSDASKAVLFFPVIALIGVIFWRLARLLRQHRADGDDVTYGDRLISLLGGVLFGVALFGVAMAAIGYLNGALKLMIPAIFTLQVFAVLLILQRVVMAVFSLVTGSRDDAQDSLIPVLIGVALVVAAIPVLAMIWGARASDLAEVWLRMTQGVEIGETRLSATDFFTFLLIFFAGFMLTRLLQGAMKNTILPKTKMDIGGRNAAVSGLGYVGIFIAGLVAINTTGLDLSSIALVAGALSVGIGFGLQNVVSNFVSGIILLIERPVSEGDWIEVGGNMGYVRKVSVRSTRIETFDRTDVIVPNADLVSGTVTNFTRGNTVGRVIVPVGVAYGTDPRRVETILMEIAKAHPMVMPYPEPSVLFQGFGASSLDFEIRAILRDVNVMLTVKSDLNHAIAARFMEEHIEIPFAQTDIWLRNPETLRPNRQDPNDPPNDKEPQE